jgi:hypothetical protein
MDARAATRAEFEAERLAAREAEGYEEFEE